MFHNQANTQAHNPTHIISNFYVGLFILIPRLINYICWFLCKVLKSSNFLVVFKLQNFRVLQVLSLIIKTQIGV